MIEAAIGVPDFVDVQFPGMPSKQNMTGEIYVEFCEKADGVRAELGLTDFSQFDARFNYAYLREEGED